MRNYITYNGVDLREYGLYISGQGAFNSPARDYEQIVIPGRDGVLLGKEDKLNATELTYRGFIYKDFRENVAKLRAFLLSNKGFFRLTDTYNPDESRLALYEGELIVEPTAKNNAGEFDLTFLVQPQRYLLSGEEVQTVDAADPPSETYSGEIVTFEDPDGDKTIQSLAAQITPVQDLHGYDHPWPGGSGKNLCYPLKDETKRGLTLTKNADGTYTLTGAYTGASNNTLGNSDAFTLPAGEYIISGGVNTYYRIQIINAVDNTVIAYSAGADSLFTLAEATSVLARVYIRYATDMPAPGGAIIAPMIRLATETDAAFEPYENICPISGWTGANVVVSPTQSAEDGTTHPVSWETEAGTVYGGEMELVSGILKARPYYASYNSETLVGPWISSMDVYTPGTKPTIGAQVVDLGGTETVYQLTPTQITTLKGQNNIWADTGDVTVVVVSPFTIENPTLFDAKPLLRVYGSGTVGIGEYTFTISEADEYTDIDCEMMDCFKGAVNKNPYVTFSNYEFPVLVPGVNKITMGAGITKIEITPRWYSV